MTQATEKQAAYINTLTDGHRVGIQSDWAMNGYRNPQRKALKARYGSDRLWDLTSEELAQEWADTVNGVLAYLDEIDQSAQGMSTVEASAMIDSLKDGRNNNIVHMYWVKVGVL